MSAAGLIPALGLAESAGLRELADQHLTVPSDKGANPGLKVSSLVAGMVAGADSIDDMALLRHGGMSRIFARAYVPSTLGSFLRSFTFGHVRQLDAVAAGFLVALTALTQLLATPVRLDTRAAEPEADPRYALLDVDDTIIEVHNPPQQLRVPGRKATTCAASSSRPERASASSSSSTWCPAEGSADPARRRRRTCADVIAAEGRFDLGDCGTELECPALT